MRVAEKVGFSEISKIIDESNPKGIVIIPGDNTTGKQISQHEIFEIVLGIVLFSEPLT